MEIRKYGFVYIWYDRKHKRFYIGCRWGTEDDGYICSSSWMNSSYKKRPKDFKRKILSRIYTNKKDLLEEEYRFLSKIKKEELGKKYYNLYNHHFGHWSCDENKLKKIGEKITKANTGRKHKPCSEETKRKISEKNSGKIFTEEHKKKLSEAKYGIKTGPRSEEVKRKIGLKNSLRRGPKSSQFGKRWTWITDGESNKRIDKDVEIIPEGWHKGMTQHKNIKNNL